ncbi:hypothetical protein HMI56_003906 [Coelomomyces lativittatus]|nr:hypothetical protein HMI56_003906 [Coelomomyces lativittatus]
MSAQSTPTSIHIFQISYLTPMPVTCIKLTGEYNGWSQENKMQFEKFELESEKRFKIEIPTEKLLNTKKFVFKFIVDGEWYCSDAFPKEYDPAGNENNYIIFNPEPFQSDFHAYLQRDSVLEVKEESKEDVQYDVKLTIGEKVLTSDSTQVSSISTSSPQKKKKPSFKTKLIWSFFRFMTTRHC